MKKLVLAAVTVVFAFMLVACGSDNDKLLGVWEDDIFGIVTFEFQKDGTLIIIAGPETEEGTYEVKGDSILMNISGDEAVFDYEINEDENKLILTFDGESQAFNKVE